MPNCCAKRGCCKNEIPSNKTVQNYACNKQCRKDTESVASDDNNKNWKDLCVYRINYKTHNFADFCRIEHADSKAQNLCKLDSCNLCCTTYDTILHLNISLKSTNDCLAKCSATYPIK